MPGGEDRNCGGSDEGVGGMMEFYQGYVRSDKAENLEVLRFFAG